MSRRPRQGRWPVIEGYSRSSAKAPQNILLWFVCAAFAGLVGSSLFGWLRGESAVRTPDSPIEWNAVQAVPKRSPDRQDIEWQERTNNASAGQAAEAKQQARPEPFAGSSNESAQSTLGPIRVIDGDTFSLGPERIRIANIDSPETHPPRCVEEARLGLAATQRLRELLGSGTVTMSGTAHDRYGRALRIVQVDGVDVGEALIGAGLARSYDGKKRQGWC